MKPTQFKEIMSKRKKQPHARGLPLKAVVCVASMLLVDTDTAKAAPVSIDSRATMSATFPRPVRVEAPESSNPGTDLHQRRDAESSRQTSGHQRQRNANTFTGDSVAILVSTCLLLLGMLVFGTRMLPSLFRGAAHWTASRLTSVD